MISEVISQPWNSNVPHPRPTVFTYASQAVSCLQAMYTFARELRVPTSPKIIDTSVSRLKDHDVSKLVAIMILS